MDEDGKLGDPLGVREKLSTLGERFKEETEEETFSYGDLFPTDQEILAEAGVVVDMDSNYDMSTREGREAFAKDLRHEMRDQFERVAEDSEITTISYDPLKPSTEEIADDIEQRAYENAVAIGSTNRPLDEEHVEQAVARAVEHYSDDGHLFYDDAFSFNSMAYDDDVDSILDVDTEDYDDDFPEMEEKRLE